MKNVFVIHSYNGDTIDSFASSIEKLCIENDVDYYFPSFPIRNDATFESWEEVLNQYKEKNLLNEDSIIISHSLGCLFIPKYLAKYNFKVHTFISVAGALNYSGKKSLEDVIKRFMPSKKDFSKCQDLVSNICSFYSDNDELNSIANLELYANSLNANKYLIRGAGHFNPKSNVRNIKELNDILNHTLKI
ncbi:MAG: hypothetical protein HFJ17_02380 [Clostridia bacterium]|nr:hypothetical protein [Clostridia bacterium]